MTSLEFIMDMDVDKEEPQVIKKDGPSSSTSGTRLDRDLLASDHEHPREHQGRLDTSPTKQKRGASGRHNKSSSSSSSFNTIAADSSTAITSTLASPLGPSTRPAPAPGNNNSNFNSEEMHRYGSHASPSGTGGGGEQPNRPMGNPGEVQVKLTPITGRVSRAKKGVPVHTCEICRPPKTFTRAEHLRRHQLSHQTPQYPCTYPGCERAFHRADLLARHATRHELEGDKASSRSTGDNSRRASTTSTGYDQGGPGPMQPSPVMSPNPSQPYPGSSYSGYSDNQYNSPALSGSQPMSPQQRRDSSGPSSHYTHHAEIPTINQPPGLDESPGLTYDTHMSNYHEVPRTAPGNGLLIVTSGLGPDAAPAMIQPELSPWASSDSNSYSSTPSDNSHRRNYNIPAFSSPPTASEWQSSFVYTPPSQGIHSPHMDVITSNPNFFQDPFYTGMIDPSMSLYTEDNHFLSHPQSHFPSVRSPTPPNMPSSVQSAESLVTLAPASHDPLLGARFKGQAALMGSLSGATFLTAFTLPKPARDAIPHFLEVYWKRFDASYPLIHRRKFELAPDEILRAAMAAVGSQFLEGKEDRLKGNQLHEWAWQEAKRQLQILQWNVSTMQTILLCEIFARFRGKKIAIKPSEPFRSLYSRDSSLFSLVFSSPSSSQWHPYSTSPLQVDTITQPPDLDHSFGSTNSTPSIGGLPSTNALQKPRWAEWVEAEARRRLLAACFAVDVHTSMYYELPLMQNFTTPYPPIPLTAASEELWNASPEEWEALTNARPASLEPAVLSEDIISREVIASAAPMDQAVFLASEVLRIPRRSASTIDLYSNPDLGDVERILTLFPDSGVAYTYAALHYTPLHDLLAVSGDSWLFSQKVLEGKAFVQYQKTLKQWCGSLHAATAARFAAKALIAFLTINNNDNNTTGGASSSIRRWNMSDVSDYWAIYVCALICWALGHRGTSPATASSSSSSGGASTLTGGSGSSGPRSSSGAGNARATASANIKERESELEALGWLHLVASQANLQDVFSHVRVGGRAVTISVVAMVRKRLEGEAAGSRSRLLIDAVGILKKLEAGVNWKWF
ncbi:hypothetical protein PFICI_13136 [Pestalotiopsis fici W106-1]|uniref:C2H2-type domain-containing protein n=1 Tax=Pestalotiopsis fici (strain W106-1 / CGMCC3.15140) TaxID=1229662 RepID=W3WNB7_PESFW|nr:uncharacterized protein PFICI_13136 [Pestalotiopsis fici W106-1]ETS74652.1 hypothetical protein PFICI_13136 [Pestalotiopsis fici W106-1]